MNKEALIDSLRKQGINENIINAFFKVKREDFIPEKFIGYSYDDITLPLEDGSTISQPSTIALMLNLLEPKQGQKILEIGSGSGYALGLISEIIKDGKVYGIELNKNLAISSRKVLSDNSIVEILNKDGSEGLPKFAPFDRILISASCSDMRIPSNIAEQLTENGIMVAAVKQSIVQFKKENGKMHEKEYHGFLFVPLRTQE